MIESRNAAKAGEGSPKTARDSEPSLLVSVTAAPLFTAQAAAAMNMNSDGTRASTQNIMPLRIPREHSRENLNASHMPAADRAMGIIFLIRNNFSAFIKSPIIYMRFAS